MTSFSQFRPLTRFSKGREKSVVENHGGATIEEILVPVIKVETKKVVKRKIEILDKEISILKPIFRIKIKPPDVEKVSAVVQGKIIEALKISSDIWQFDLSSVNLKTRSLNIEFHFGAESEVKEMRVKGGIEEEEMFR